MISARSHRALGSLDAGSPLRGLAQVVALLILASPALALDKAKKPTGTDHEAAHAWISDGTGVRVGIVESTPATGASTTGIDEAKCHFCTRKVLDHYFVGQTPPVTVLPPVATGSDSHGTLVGDIALSDDATFTGVAPEADFYGVWTNNYHSNRAAFDFLQREKGVYVFNTSWSAGSTTNGTSQFALFFDWFASHKGAVLIGTTANAGATHKLIGQPAGAYNVITVGAVDHTFRARAIYSSYWVSYCSSNNEKRGNPCTLDSTCDVTGGDGVCTQDDGTQPDFRAKPDIVAPGGQSGATQDPANKDGIESGAIEKSGVSFAAPQVAGVVALLVARGLDLPGVFKDRLAHKAIILNSARKRQINLPANEDSVAEDYIQTNNEASDYDYLNPDGETLQVGATGAGRKTVNWTPTQWSYDGSLFTTTRPLDDELGTGVLDAHRAMHQHAGGRQSPGLVDFIGWNVWSDSNTKSPDPVYLFKEEIRAGTFVTVTLTWDRKVDTTDMNESVDAVETYLNSGGEALSVQDLDLRLYLQQGEDWILVARSVAVGGAEFGENVEHLHVPVPHDGIYMIHVMNNGAVTTNFGIAWWTVDVWALPTHTPMGLALVVLLLPLLGAAYLMRERWLDPLRDP